MSVYKHIIYRAEEWRVCKHCTYKTTPLTNSGTSVTHLPEGVVHERIKLSVVPKNHSHQSAAKKVVSDTGLEPVGNNDCQQWFVSLVCARKFGGQTHPCLQGENLI